jgi:hypothetical protein
MKPNLKVILPSLAALALCGVGLFLFYRDTSSSKASEPFYRSMSALNNSHENKQFTDLKCLSMEDKSLVRGAFILRDANHINPKGVKYRDVLVALKIVTQYETVYALQAVDYRKGGCNSYYTSIEDGEESNPLSRVFTDEKAALETQLIWDKWRLANVPNWKGKMQRILNRPRVQLAKEEYLSLKQLGFKMPKKWEEIK